MYERAYQLWCSTGRNGARVERILTAMVTQETPDGETIPPVPSLRTINDWAVQDRWEERFLRDFVADLPAKAMRYNVDLSVMVDSAFDALFDCRSGRYDHDPKLRAAVERGAHDTLKLAGVGTAGANQGGLWLPNAQDILKALGQTAEEAKAIPPSAVSRNNREAIADSKRGRE